jgi:hypothetical protein
LSIVTTGLPVQGTDTFHTGFRLTNRLEPVQLRFQILSGPIEALTRTSLERIGEVRFTAAASHAMEAPA